MSPVKDLGEFYKWAAKEIRYEEAFGSKKLNNQKSETGSSNPSKKRSSEGNNNWGQRNHNQIVEKARNGPRPRNDQRHKQFLWLSHYENYAVLSNIQDRIFTTKKNRENFRKPVPMRMPNRFKDKSRYCVYHNKAGHKTSECWALKDVIEELIRHDRLRDYMVRPVEQRPQNQRPQ